MSQYARNEGEPLPMYWWRQFAERPLAVIAFGCLGAVCYLHVQARDDNADHRAELAQMNAEHREYMRSQNAAQVQTMTKMTEAVMSAVSQLEQLNQRVSHLEREHENARLNPSQ